MASTVFASSTFVWQDYVVFSVMLVISSAIGLFFGIRAKRKKTATSEDMLTGGRHLPVFPVAMSLSAGFTSATTILGIPAEVYSNGGEQWLWIFGFIPCFLTVAFFIVPVFWRLQLTNAYEYLEIRFNKIIRGMGSFAFCIIILTYMAAVLYAPAVALSQVTGISREISILAMGLVCTFYTSIGGIRAVVWTDAFQLIVVWTGLLALMFKGANDVGGWGKVWSLAQDGDRLPRFDMDPDPFVRHTFWTLFIGGGFNMMTVYGSNQTNLQRYASVRTLKGARLALLLNLPLWICYLTVLCLLGLVMYAYFICDPLTYGAVAKRDQLIPLFVLETMGAFPGLPGLFVASIFSASISTVSSGVNSLAAVCLEDVIKPLYKRVKHAAVPESSATVFTIFLVIFFGCLTIFLAYLAGNVGKTAVQISFAVFGMVGGPLLGLIINGIFLPFINSWGAGVGMFVSLVACLYVGIDPVFNRPPSRHLPYRLDGCPSDNSSLSEVSDNGFTTVPSLYTSTYNSTMETTPEPSSSSDHLYLSYIHYATLAILLSTIVGAFVSLITGCNKGRDIDPRTILHYPSWCGGRASSSYEVTHTDDTSHKRNSNISRHDVTTNDYGLYVNDDLMKGFKPKQSAQPDRIYANGAYTNHL